MKGLLKYLSPAATDISGAAAVLFELQGLTVIADAGGCTGNVCGFDEPRWFSRRSAIFSAGLRDMDAIMGRDDQLAKKIAAAAKELSPRFTAVIGTPVPAVIATDYKALSRLVEKATNLPCITVAADGTKHYDAGASAAQLALLQRFSAAGEKRGGSAVLLGATPLDLSRDNAEPEINAWRERGCTEVCALGMGSDIDAYVSAAAAARAVVLSPSGYAAAKFLQETCGTAVEISAPQLSSALTAQLTALNHQRVLVIHQQFAANEIRRQLGTGCQTDVASWFMMIPEFRAENDFSIRGEADFAQRVEGGNYDVIIADSCLQRLAPTFTGKWIDFPHFALSGTLEN